MPMHCLCRDFQYKCAEQVETGPNLCVCLYLVRTPNQICGKGQGPIHQHAAAQKLLLHLLWARINQSRAPHSSYAHRSYLKRHYKQ